MRVVALKERIKKLKHLWFSRNTRLLLVVRSKISSLAVLAKGFGWCTKEMQFHIVCYTLWNFSVYRRIRSINAARQCLPHDKTLCTRLDYLTIPFRPPPLAAFTFSTLSWKTAQNERVVYLPSRPLSRTSPMSFAFVLSACMKYERFKPAGNIRRTRTHAEF